MGVVYKGYDTRLDRRVALKRVLDNEGDSQRRQRFRREARTAAQLSHPAVVQIFDLIEDETGDWIVMELVEGPTLAQVLKGGPLPLPLAVEYGRQIAEGLAAAHGLDIVHRDLKTENVVVLPDERVKILDFGLAKRLVSAIPGSGGPVADESLSVAGQIMGTGRAMAPEQARGLEVGPRSDLFSFGVLLYEMLTGISPFRGPSFFDTLSRIATHRPLSVGEVVRGVPQELSDLVDRLLAKAPELRPASAGQTAAQLSRLLDGLRSGASSGPAAEAVSAETVIDSEAGYAGDGREPTAGPPSPSPGEARSGGGTVGRSFMPVSTSHLPLGVAVVVLGAGIFLAILSDADHTNEAGPAVAPLEGAFEADLREEEVVAALREHRYRPAAAADALGIPRSSIYDLMDKIPGLRKAGELSAEEIEAARARVGPSVEAMAEELEVSERALRRRMGELKQDGN